MNNLELYENFNHRWLKKYFIDDMSRSVSPRYYLFRVDNQSEASLKLTKMMAYDFEIGIIHLNIDDEKYELELKDFIIIYESDDYDDVENYFMLVDSKKYNL
jgi:hypothetical protein